MTDTTTPADSRNRRQVLCGLMVALVAPGVLAACSSDTGSGSGGTTTTPGGAPAGTTGGSSGGATGSSGALSTVSAIPDGGGLLVNGGPSGKVLLVRDGTTVKGFDPTCPHQGATVDPPKDGVITCPRHFSTFDPATGARKSGQAQTGLAVVEVKVDGENVVLA
ncbi:Rieske (2Fe-2S) protein [Actinokineospora auranticolor]|uniref:Nitrite reductase/ring-hydroxylating ferredoxin subunit n=1 Tax=Actinokineospora auranticolor TaxID=155976 RepID=A0A2S6GNL1_9PSEU|nr:Rieske (2Fe-2S) protein [Actinokineospora auranticolor]PPK66766.1 nitrite reductase/ring-hydroxylating ferredoxin subunit [Actinokineospora auranticolor]